MRQLQSRSLTHSLTHFLSLVLSLSPGMFISSTAFLPSSFAMYMTMIASSAYLQSHFRLAIGATAAGALIGWPFAAVTGIHIAVDLTLRKKDIFYFLKVTWITRMLISSPSPPIRLIPHSVSFL